MYSILRRWLRNDDALLLAEGKGARLIKYEIASALWERWM